MVTVPDADLNEVRLRRISRSITVVLAVGGHCE